MKWRKALTVLAARKKIDSAAMFDMRGNLLSRTDNFAEKQEHIEAVLKVLASTSHLKLLKLRVFGDVFTCVCPGPAGILLAHSQDDRLFVGVRSPCCMVIAFANQGARGSCLYEVMEFTKLLEKKVCPYSKPYTLPESSPKEDPEPRDGDGSEASSSTHTPSDEESESGAEDTAEPSEVAEPCADCEASGLTQPAQGPEGFSHHDDVHPSGSGRLYTLHESSEEAETEEDSDGKED